ncbi:MAG: hypothetical protein PHN22_05120 [Candidatus ainarchaeum sp.]|nr:hypothetical protein [Candidatus ainarchaeum sp.]
MYGNCTSEEYYQYTANHTEAYIALLSNPDNLDLQEEERITKELLDSCEYQP